jgi:outer membrane immunogenic protein
MKHSLLASTALCAAFASGALAADLPTMKGPPPAPMPVVAPFSWTGFYIGGNIGAVFDPDSVQDLGGNCCHFYNGGTDTLNPTGVVGGLQAGYNYQIQSFVVGVEGDLDGTSASASRGGVLGGSGAGQPVHSASLPFFADLRARFGMAFDRFLPYVTGGVVFADLTNKLSDTGYTPPLSVSRGSEATGWTIGGGVEYAIDNHWSVKAEYLYMQFPDVTKSVTDGATYAFKFKDSAQLARVGLNYRF